MNSPTSFIVELEYVFWREVFTTAFPSRENSDGPYSFFDIGQRSVGSTEDDLVGRIIGARDQAPRREPRRDCPFDDAFAVVKLHDDVFDFHLVDQNTKSDMLYATIFWKIQNDHHV